MFPSSRVRRAAALLLSAALGVGVAGAVSSAAAAAVPVPAHAIGAARSVTAVTGGLLVTGWAGDPDAPTDNVRVIAIIGGTKVVARSTTSLPKPAVSKAHGLGATPGFALTVPVPTGNHTVCIVAKSATGGLDEVLDCVLTPLGRATTSTITAAHSPAGAIVHGRATKRAVVFSGWADDPDDLLRPSVVKLYLDGQLVARDVTSDYDDGTPPAGASSLSGFTFRVPVTAGSHLGCLWVKNVGLGEDTFLGCDAVDTRANQPVTGTAPAATATKVVKEAKKHIGQRYVYGAAGPKKFDCSGLVTYSYGKFGYSAPHQAAAQFAMAYVIPAEQAVPGDLVFYHDSTGAVYHVGIYTGPGMTVAAIDTAEGVNYQSIYSSTWATYGSFTHGAATTS